MDMGVVMYIPVWTCVYVLDTVLSIEAEVLLHQRSLFHSFLLKEVKKIKEALEIPKTYSWSLGNV